MRDNAVFSVDGGVTDDAQPFQERDRRQKQGNDHQHAGRTVEPGPGAQSFAGLGKGSPNPLAERGNLARHSRLRRSRHSLLRHNGSRFRHLFLRHSLHRSGSSLLRCFFLQHGLYDLGRWSHLTWQGEATFPQPLLKVGQRLGPEALQAGEHFVPLLEPGQHVAHSADTRPK